MKDEVDWDRFARQVVLPEIGPSGQVKLRNSAILIEGDSSITATACDYLIAAGIGSVDRRDDPYAAPGTARSSIHANTTPIHVSAQRTGATVGPVPISPSPLAPHVFLSSAGMLLAIESIKRILGVGTGENWSIDLPDPPGQ